MSAEPAYRSGVALDHLIADVIAASHWTIAERPRQVAEALRPNLTAPDLLDGIACPACPENYVRHILYACPEGRFSLMALVWMPGQQSPIHAHRAWCALGVHQGTLTESFFATGADGSPIWISDQCRAPGDLSFGGAGEAGIHCLANRSKSPAISLHAYGLPPDRLCTDLNRLYLG